MIQPKALRILEVLNPMTKISAGSPGQNSHRKKGAENIVQLISDGIKDNAQSSDKTISYDAEYSTICANQEEILRWYYYEKEFLTQVSVIVQNGKGKIGEKRQRV
ncbi:hypothetical protein C1646_778521 [Rhizophagus diaphanus]|nr:hypothetical protein C1646_778521 [Rhizophagus diaphanus] [Rhizophagus sp. MUCL 43196]